VALNLHTDAVHIYGVVINLLKHYTGMDEMSPLISTVRNS
jgi:hypothetical protein